MIKGDNRKRRITRIFFLGIFCIATKETQQVIEKMQPSITGFIIEPTGTSAPSISCQILR